MCEHEEHEERKKMKFLPKGKFDFRNVAKNVVSKDGAAIKKRL